MPDSGKGARDALKAIDERNQKRKAEKEAKKKLRPKPRPKFKPSVAESGKLPDLKPVAIRGPVTERRFAAASGPRGAVAAADKGPRDRPAMSTGPMARPTADTGPRPRPSTAVQAAPVQTAVAGKQATQKPTRRVMPKFTVTATKVGGKRRFRNDSEKQYQRWLKASRK